MSLIDEIAASDAGAAKLMSGWKNSLEKLYKNNAVKPFTISETILQRIISAYYDLIKRGSTVVTKTPKETNIYSPEEYA